MRLFFIVRRSADTFWRMPSMAAALGLERCAVRGDGIVDVNLDFALDDGSGLLLHAAFHAIFDVGEEGYEEALSGRLPSMIAHATGAARINSAAPAHRWLNKCNSSSSGSATSSGCRSLTIYFA